MYYLKFPQGAAMRLFVASLFFGVFCLGASAFAQTYIHPPDKVSSAILAHQAEKALYIGASRSARVSGLALRGLNPDALDREDTALYVDQPLSDSEINQLAAEGITVHETYVPPVPGKHPYGYYLATVEYASLNRVRADNRFIRLDSTEVRIRPFNDLAAVATNVDDVFSGTGVTALTGAGVSIAVADTGIDLDHGDFPLPIEKFDMTDGTGPGDWGTDVSNTVSDHGTHVTASALGRGTLSGGQYKGAAPGASLYFYKIMQDTPDLLATETDQIEAITRAALVGVDIFSLSFGGYTTFLDGSGASSQAVDSAVASGTAVFVAAGNQGDVDIHFSVDVAPTATSATISYTVDNTLGIDPYTATEFFRVIWLDNLTLDGNVTIAVTNLGGGESVFESTSEISSKGTESKLYGLVPNIAAGVSKTYTLTVTNNAVSGITPSVQLYALTISGINAFDVPDYSYSVVSPAIADSAFAVGAWTQRLAWDDWTGVSWLITDFVPSYVLNARSPFSSRGPRIDSAIKPDFLAPGAATISARDSVLSIGSFPLDPLTIDDDGLTLNGSGPANYYIKTGTSMATPFAAGIGALLLQADPSLTPADLYAALTLTASLSNAPTDEDGYGLLDALGAVIFVLEGVFADADYVGSELGTQANPYNSIQESVDAINDGDTIWIKGAFPEAITLSKPMTIKLDSTAGGSSTVTGP